ncbi:hypothetical protein [Streptomyces sp. NPDC096153]|uniref:hypothetical protein n=1 Tax=Streptomyces sp. NPDC096153 TaxID=3155548 RepID=UPI00332D44A8
MRNDGPPLGSGSCAAAARARPEQAYRDYVDLGSPPSEAYGLVVRPEAEYLWPPRPGNVLAPAREASGP